MKNSFTKSVESLLRNWTTTLPTILVMAIVLSMFHGLLVIHTKAKETLAGIQQKFSITVYLKDDADQFAVADLIGSLENRGDVVKPVVYTSKEAAWELMSRTFSLDNELLKKYKFSLPASLTITPRAPQDAADIYDFIGTQSRALVKDTFSAHGSQKKVTDQMIAFITTIRDATLGTLFFFIVFFIIGGTLLMSSAIHLAMSYRRQEIRIMKLIGASLHTIATPFIIEGLIISATAFLGHLAILALLPFETGSSVLFKNALLFEFAAAMILGLGVSRLTAYVHMKKN